MSTPPNIYEFTVIQRAQFDSRERRESGKILFRTLRCSAKCDFNFFSSNVLNFNTEAFSKRVDNCTFEFIASQGDKKKSF